MRETMMADETDSLKARVESLLQQRGLTARAASMQAVGNPELVRTIRAGRQPRPENLAALARVLGTTVDYLLSGAVSAAAPARSEIRRAQVAPPVREAMPRDVPVFGTAAGALLSPNRTVEPKAGAFVISDDTVDYVRRPPALENVRDAYALYIEGESMIPAYRPGDLVFVNPHRKVRPGDMVILQCRFVPHDDGGEVEAYVKQLVRRGADTTSVQQFNPAATIQFDNRHIVDMHRVMTLGDLFGI